MRAGLRRRELVALQWGDIQLAGDDNPSARFTRVQHNYVHREHTTTKSKKARRVALFRELRSALVELRDQRLLEAYLKGKTDISNELVFRSSQGTIVDPDNLYDGVFLPVLAKAGIAGFACTIYGIPSGRCSSKTEPRSVYVKEQMGHSSIQVTIDIYGHLIPGTDVCYARLDAVGRKGGNNPAPIRTFRATSRNGGSARSPASY